MILLGLPAAAPGQNKGEPAPPLPEPDMPWRTQVRLPGDPFLAVSTGHNEPAWVKFSILLDADGPGTVYFQDSRQYPFHYSFATEHLAPFAGMTPEQFDRVTLHRQGRRAVLGALLTPGALTSSGPREYAIQLVGLDPFTKEEVLALFEAVKPCILTDGAFTAFYFPTCEQRTAAEVHRTWLAAQGISISSPDRWADDNTCYAPGWALGRLKYVEGGAIGDAHRVGIVGPNDILLTDGVPAETPLVGGIITLSPSTPNSHVAILSRTRGMPFVHLALAEDANRAAGLVGHRICLRACETYDRTEVRLIDVEGILDEATIEEIRAVKKPPELALAPATPYGVYAMNTAFLLPSDIGYFGGKAANFGLLRRAIPDHAPVAAAFSFDLWQEFLNQPLPGGRLLREAIAQRLAGFQYPPADMAALSRALAGIRDLFTEETVTIFTPAQQQAVLAVLQDPQYGFDPARKLRFRSSTNVEDSFEFTGAGLYDSYSGCLADDFDGDAQGPCRCDPERDKERSVFTVIRKVFASFYNDNAYLERLRYGLDETKVGMALLVHHSWPDEIELANGVATVARTSETGWQITLVTQQGAASVTNPPDGSIPEEVTVSVYEFGSFAIHVRRSNLVQLGATVLQWQDDYLQLAGLLAQVGAEFAAVTGRDQFVLEMEYKKVVDERQPQGRLIVKQVRALPQPDRTPTITPFLVSEPAQYCVEQGEFGDIFAHHRLKSQWGLRTGSFWLTPACLRDSLYEQATFEYVAGGALSRLSGKISDWPEGAHDFNEPVAMETWRVGDPENPRRYRLYTGNIRTLVAPAESAIMTLGDFGNLTLEAEYEKPVVQWDWPSPTMGTVEQVWLVPRRQPGLDERLQTRVFDGPGGIRIETSFYWPPRPKGPTVGYTAPLARWVETRIAGYTTEPIVLHSDYAQTYKPEHHNFGEHFLFEPQLEPGLPPETRVELRDRDIRWIHVYGSRQEGGGSEATITIYNSQEEPRSQ